MNGNSEQQIDRDLKDLSERIEKSECESRAARVAALKALYQAGELTLDSDAIASKLVDSHLEASGADLPNPLSQK